MTEKTRQLNFKLLANAVRWRLPIVLVAVLATPLVALIAVSLYQPPFTASAKVLIQAEEGAEDPNPVLADLRLNWESITNLGVIQTILHSRAFAERMIYELELIPEATGAEELDRAVRDFQYRIKVVDHTGIVEIQYAADTPEEATTGLQSVLSALIDEMVRPHAESLNASVDFLAGQLARIREDLNASEVAVRDFRESNADLLPEVHTLNLELYLQSHRELMDGESEIAALEEQSRLQRERLRSYYPEVVEIEHDLGRARDELSSLSANYAANHPQMVAAREEVSNLQRRLEQARASAEPLPVEEVERLFRSGDIPISAGGLEDEIIAYRSTLSQIEEMRERMTVTEGRFQELRGLVSSFVGSEQGLSEMVREVEAQSEVYTRLLAQYQDALVTREMTLHEEASEVWIVDEPSVPLTGGRPALRMVVAAGLGAGIFLALLLVIIGEVLGKTVRLPEEASELSGLPTVVVLPPLAERQS